MSASLASAVSTIPLPSVSTVRRLPHAHVEQPPDGIHLEDPDRVGRGPAEHGARPDVELRAVAVAENPVPFEIAVCEGALLVRAPLVERGQPTLLGPRERDIEPGNRRGPHRAGAQIALRDPVATHLAHRGSTSRCQGHFGYITHQVSPVKRCAAVGRPRKSFRDRQRMDNVSSAP